MTSANSYQVLARKWRPQDFQTVVGQEHILRMISNSLNQARHHHAYLLAGIRGVGKTTIARILAKCFNCETGITANPCGTCDTCLAIEQGRFLDLLEIDAASRTKVEDTREILDNIHYAPTEGRFKIYLIDEVHMLSNHSFNALLKTLEEPPAHIIFILATTDPKRLPITILSRCLQFNLKRLTPEQIATQLQQICQQENVSAEASALLLLARAADGSMRDALSLLDQAIAYCPEQLTTTDIEQMLGTISQDYIFRLLQTLQVNDGKQLFAEVNRIAELGPNYEQVLEELLNTLHQIAVAQTVTDTPYSASIQQFAKQIPPEEIQLYYQIALIGRRDLAITPNPQQGFEMIMLRLLAFKPASNNTPTTPLIEKKSVTSTSDSRWNTLLPQLGLTGMTQALAANCSLISETNDKIILTLSNKHAAMLNQQSLTRIEQALNKHFNRKITVDIKLSQQDLQDTPTKHQEKIHQERQAAATESIVKDSNVQKMMELFGATIDATKFV